jgi:hypothetical protein
MSKQKPVYHVAYRYWGALRGAVARNEVVFYRLDPRDTDGASARRYRHFTVASARRVQRLIDGGRVFNAEDRAMISKRFRPFPARPRLEVV